MHAIYTLKYEEQEQQNTLFTKIKVILVENW